MRTGVQFIRITDGDDSAPPEHHAAVALLDDLEGGHGEENQKHEYDQQEDPEGQTQCVGQRLIGRVHGFAHRRRRAHLRIHDKLGGGGPSRQRLLRWLLLVKERVAILKRIGA